MSKRKHACKLDCYKVIDGKLVNTCSTCAVGMMTQVLGYEPTERPAAGASGEGSRFVLSDVKEIGKVEQGRKGIMADYRSDPSDFDAALHAAWKLAVKWKQRMIVVPGNSYMRRTWNLLPEVKVTLSEIKRYIPELRRGMAVTVAYVLPSGTCYQVSLMFPEARGETKALGYTPRSVRDCSSGLVAEEMRAWKSGKSRIKSRQQAIAVGLSRARKEC